MATTGLPGRLFPVLARLDMVRAGLAEGGHAARPGALAGWIAANDAPPPGVDISIAAASANEGDDISFVVTLSTALLEARTLDIGYTPETGDTGASLGDLGSGRPATLNLPTGVRTVNLVVPTFEDTDNELDETFTVTLSLPDPPPADRMNTLNITTATATGTIEDDDAPTGDVIVSIDDASVGEGDDSVTLTARFSRTVSQNVTLGITYQDGTATFADDLSGDPAPPRTVTIEANTLSADFTVFIRNDTVDEPEETLTVSLGGSNFPAGQNFVFNGSHRATLTIIDNDPPLGTATVSIGNASVAENGGNAEFTVSQTTTVTSDVVLAVAYAAGTATLGTDLGTRPDTVTIDQGQTEATLLVPIFNDEIVEGNEDFTVTISEGSTALPEGVTIGTAATGTGTITDNDEAEVTLGPATLEAAENGTFTYTVSLSAPADEAVTVRWTATDGTAIVDDDLQEQTDTVTFAANDNTAQEFTISPVDDPDDEVNETFTVTLEVDGDNPLPTGVTIGTNNSSTATITDNDDPTGPDLTVDGVSVSSASVVEGASFTINATVNNGGNAASAATTLTYYRSADATITTDDTSIATDAVGILAASGSSTQDASVSIATAGTYHVGACVPTVSGETDTDNNCSTGVQVTVTAAVAPQITTQPTDQSVTVGDDATFTVAATGTPTPTYQWRFDGTDISGATSETYTLSNAALTNAGDYTVVVTNTVSSVTSSVATLTVTAPDLTVDGVSVSSASVVEGASFTINATVNNEGNAASAATTLTYYRSADATITTDDTSIGTDPIGILAANGSSTQDASVSIATAGTYHVGACVPTVSGETDTDNNCSTGVQVTVTAAAVAPQITTQPTDQSVTVGDDATFTVAATGTPTPTYQWRLDGSDISGATSETLTISGAALTNAGDYTVVVSNTASTVTSTAATLTVNDEAAPPASKLSVLIDPRLIGAGTALRRHVSRFDRMTGTVVRNRLDGRGMKRLTASQDLGSGAVAVGGSFDQGRLDQGRWGAWIDGAWAGFDGKATGRQADIHGGVDYLAPDGNWLIGALIGHEVADLKIGKATYRSQYTHVGLYGGARLWQHLLFDGAVTYGRATPDIALGDVSASHDANRITARGALTGDFGLDYGLWTGSVRIEPQLGVLYSRERLGAFTDSAGGVGQGETLELGRFSAGPRLTWGFDGGRLTGGARMQWDFLELDTRNNADFRLVIPV